MLSPAMIRHLRRTPLWGAAQRLQRAVSGPSCGAIHAAVQRLGPDRLPDDLVLKHIYDYRTVDIDPRLIHGTVRVGDWFRIDANTPSSRLDRMRRWYAIGGGWKSARRQVTRNLHGHFVADGDWDRRTKPFRLRPTIVELFQEGRRPEDTAEYKKLCEWVAAGDLLWTRGCATRQDVDAYFTRLQRVYEDIRENGYRTQAELGVEGSDEIRVCIDREGRPCVFGGGTHRLSIALLLGLERVPVIVKRVHARWAAECVARYGAPLHVAVSKGLAELEPAGTSRTHPRPFPGKPGAADLGALATEPSRGLGSRRS